jgi:single-strand DNA-binding protein
VYYKENGDKVENRMAPCNGLKTAEIIEKYVTKGKVAIEGKLTHRSYDDKDGVKRFIVVANELLLLGKQ